jgi:hypothetical protein
LVRACSADRLAGKEEKRSGRTVWRTHDAASALTELSIVPARHAHCGPGSEVSSDFRTVNELALRRLRGLKRALVVPVECETWGENPNAF